MCAVLIVTGGLRCPVFKTNAYERLYSARRRCAVCGGNDWEPHFDERGMGQDDRSRDRYFRGANGIVRSAYMARAQVRPPTDGGLFHL